MQILKILQKEKINTPEIKEYGDIQTTLELEIHENPDSSLIGTIHPTWYKDFEFPKEVYLKNLSLCYMNGIEPVSTIVESVFAFWDLIMHKKLYLLKDKNLDGFLISYEFYKYTKQVQDIVLEAISIQPNMFITGDGLNTVSDIVNENLKNTNVQGILDSMFDILDANTYARCFKVSKKILHAIEDFCTNKREIFPTLSRVQMEKILTLTEHLGYDVKRYIGNYEDIPNMREIAHNYIEPQTISERFLCIKRISYFVHQNEINQAIDIIGNSSIHYRTLQSQGVDLEFLGMNKIRKSNLVTSKDAELLKEAMPFVQYTVEHRVLEDGMMATLTSGSNNLGSVKIFEFKYVLHGNEVYDVELLYQSNESVAKQITSSTNKMAFWMALSSMANATDCLLDEQVINKFKVNEPSWR